MFTDLVLGLSRLNRVLVVAAHADDETLGSGGLLARLSDLGIEVHVVILSDGLVTVRGESQDNRPACLSACRVLGAQDPIFLGLPDQRFEEIAIADIVNQIVQLGLDFDMVITHSSSCLNNDHRICCDVAKIVGRPKSKPIGILQMEIPNSAQWNGALFCPNFYVDIESTIHRKLEALAFYSNEILDYPHPYSFEGVERQAKYRGMEAGLNLCEAYHIQRVIT